MPYCTRSRAGKTGLPVLHPGPSDAEKNYNLHSGKLGSQVGSDGEV